MFFSFSRFDGRNILLTHPAAKIHISHMRLSNLTKRGKEPTNPNFGSRAMTRPNFWLPEGASSPLASWPLHDVGHQQHIAKNVMSLPNPVLHMHTFLCMYIYIYVVIYCYEYVPMHGCITMNILISFYMFYMFYIYLYLVNIIEV